MGFSWIFTKMFRKLLFDLFKKGRVLPASKLSEVFEI